MQFDDDAQLLVMTTKVPSGTHLGFGWGADMFETSMFSWHADGDDSWTQELYSERNGYPPERETGCYTTSFQVLDEHVEFTTKRALDCGPESFVVKLEEQIPLCSSWKDVPYLSFHGDNAVAFSCEIDTD